MSVQHVPGYIWPELQKDVGKLGLAYAKHISRQRLACECKVYRQSCFMPPQGLFESRLMPIGTNTLLVIVGQYSLSRLTPAAVAIDHP
jgi:hypothetical protein